MKQTLNVLMKITPNRTFSGRSLFVDSGQYGQDPGLPEKRNGKLWIR